MVKGEGCSSGLWDRSGGRRSTGAAHELDERRLVGVDTVFPFAEEMATGMRMGTEGKTDPIELIVCRR
jgi:hypothetical protein